MRENVRHTNVRKGNNRNYNHVAQKETGVRKIRATQKNTGANRTGSARSIRRNTKTGLVKFTLAVLVVAAVVCVILVGNRSVINADESGNVVQLEKYYKTITVQRGDTLWSIAKEYKSGDYRTVQDYVEELKSMNNLGTDQITAGNKLVVAYFEES